MRRRRQDETVAQPKLLGCDIGAVWPGVRSGLVVQNSGTIPTSGRQPFPLLRTGSEGVGRGWTRGDCR